LFTFFVDNPGDIAMTSAWTDAPGRTLFVGRLHYDLTEEELKTEFTHFGEITRVVLPRTRAGRSVGYAFVEFSSADSVKRALAEADGQSLMGRRIVVDTERARSESGWLPRRLGGGLGLTRAGPPALCRTSPGRVSEGRLPPAVAEAYARGGMPAVAALNAHGPAHTQHHAADRRSGSGPRGPGAGDRGGDRGGGFRGGDRGGDRRGGEWRGGGGGDRGRGDRDRSDRDRGYGGDRGGDRDRAGYRDGGRDRRF
jgi:U1 small nuclear ribonucleoprotein